jgi:integrase
MDCLTTDELLSVLRIARSRSFRDWAMILLAYRHGLRASEVCTLRMTDVNLKDSSLSVQRLKGSLYTVQPLYRHRGQPLLDETKALQSWFQQRRPDGSDFLFLSQKGGRLHRSQFFRVSPLCLPCVSAANEAASSRSKTFSRYALGRKQRKFGSRGALPGASGYWVDDEIRRCF